MPICMLCCAIVELSAEPSIGRARPECVRFTTHCMEIQGSQLTTVTQPRPALSIQQYVFRFYLNTTTNEPESRRWYNSHRNGECYMCGAPAAHAAHPASLSPVPQQTTLALRSPSRLLSSGASPEAPPATNTARTSFVHRYQVLRTIRVTTLIIG